MPPNPPPAVIETRALTKVYPGHVTALDGLTVSVPPGVTGKQEVIVMYNASLDGNALGIQTVTPVKM